MANTITVRDESASGKIIQQIQLVVPSEKITVRELIRSRVYQEVKDHNVQQATGNRQACRSLVTPLADEVLLNGEATVRPIDWATQFHRAVDAYRRGQILILVDDQQTQSLDEQIKITSASSISFLRLTILTGG